MKNLTLLLVLFSLFLTGCGNFSPRQRQDIENNGKIGEVESMANSLKAEVGKLQSQSDIQNSQLEKVQQGLANLQSTNENSGVQILSGPGGLTVAVVAVVAIFTLGVMTLYYRRLALIQEKTATILAQRVVEQENPALEDAVFQAAMYTECEENILALIRKHKA